MITHQAYYTFHSFFVSDTAAFVGSSFDYEYLLKQAASNFTRPFYSVFGAELGLSRCSLNVRLVQGGEACRHINTSRRQ